MGFYRRFIYNCQAWKQQRYINSLHLDNAMLFSTQKINELQSLEKAWGKFKCMLVSKKKNHIKSYLL